MLGKTIMIEGSIVWKLHLEQSDHCSLNFKMRAQHNSQIVIRSKTFQERGRINLSHVDWRIVWQLKPPHNGILSCFFHGFVTFLPASMLSERQMRRRVELGLMTSSM